VKLLKVLAICILWFHSVSQGSAQAQPPEQEPGAQQPAQAQKPAAKEASAEERIPPAAANALFPAVVARVNSKAILGRDLEQRIREELLQIGSPAWQNLRDDYRQELVARHLSSLISSELLYQSAVAAGTSVTEAEVQAELDKLTKSLGSDAALNTELANRGMERADLRKELEKTILVNRYIQEGIDKKVTVTPEEVTDYYAKHPDEFKHPDLVRSSHILIPVAQGAPPAQDAEARQRAESVLLRVRKGEDFAKLARENSGDSSASSGGDIGFTEKGQLDPAYDGAAWSLAVGQVSGLIRSSFGYHIIKVTEKKKAGVATLEESRAQLTNFLKEQKRTAELDRLVKELRDKAKISVQASGVNVPGL
jgi:peptidyl-prolyl cis-trans isomerase C